MRHRSRIQPAIGRKLAWAVCAALAVVGAAHPAHAALPADSVGIYSEELERANSIDAVKSAGDLRATGAGLVRQPFLWSRIETQPGRLSFAVYDDVVAAAALAGLTVLPVLMDPPPWRSTAPASGASRAMYPPADPAAMATLAAALVQRYGPGGRFWAAHPTLPPSPIRSWQVWNEPNIRTFWATGPDPAAYAALLRAAATAIRTVDPAAEVVAAGLPHAETGISIGAFLDGMYAAGARGAFDTLAIHPYASDASAVLDILRATRQKLDGLGDPGRPIWATEFGWATGGPPVTVTVSEADHATLLRDTIALMQRARDALRLRGFVAFRWRDVAPNPGQNDLWPLHAGLLRADGSPKPALGALRDAVGIWHAQPTAAQALGLADLQAQAGADATAGVTGVRRRTLRIRRQMKRGRLVVLVDIPPGGRDQRVKISFEGVRGGRIIVRGSRRVGTRRRVARAVFRLGPRARSAALLRITARQGSDRATRTLHMRVRRPSL